MQIAYMLTSCLEAAAVIIAAAPIVSPLVPARIANQSPAIAAVSARAFCAVVALAGLLGMAMMPAPAEIAMGPVALRVDGFAAVLMALTGLIGWIVSGYARTHLRDEVKAGDFQKWIVVATGGAAVAVMATDLLTVAFGLFVSGAAMHPLLTHYSDRPVAKEAATAKFIFNRTADACLLLAAYFAYRTCGSVDLSIIGSWMGQPGESTSGPVVAILIAVAAVIRSVQIPFHGWLPGTVEAPVPVSALMHAGIVNGGGILLIRSSGIISHVPAVMIALFIVGAGTAILAALITASQSNVKQQLAFSTVAQMGFMVMECGLGAFTAATLHIVAHSLYKAHAFLNSGNVLREAPLRSPVALSAFGAVFGPLGIIAILLVAYESLGIGAVSHAGGVLLGFIIGLAGLRWWNLSRQAGAVIQLAFAVALVGVLVIYALSYSALDTVMIASATQTTGFSPPLWLCLMGGSLFYLLNIAEAVPLHRIVPSLADALRVHAGSGFYVDHLWRRTLRTINS